LLKGWTLGEQLVGQTAAERLVFGSMNRPSTAQQRPTFGEQRGEYGSGDLEAQLREAVRDTRAESRFERIRPDGHVLEVRRNYVPGGGAVLIYSDITERKRAEEEIRTARDAAERALGELKLAQANLIQAEKMASWGNSQPGSPTKSKTRLTLSTISPISRSSFWAN
jgi:hypothetical protein